MDVEGWLRRLGLDQYAAAFHDNAIDAEVLQRLTSDDLKDIGVAAVGHRRKLLDAIAALGAVSSPPDIAAVPAPPRAKDEAERRPITVMFCDLVGSTSMAAKMDAEDWRELVGAYLDEASNAVTQYGGHVLKKLGDGIMALFGYPKAQENDAERAARAGLAILRALDDLNGKNAAHGLPALAARIGLESGLVVVDATGEVFGDAPNVAARVQSAAEPGTLLVTAAVQRQVAGLFVAEDKGPHELKGVPGRPPLFRLVRASGGGRRAGARSLTLLVGREEELAQLARRWERARAGEGQFVQIVGEPGLGKSRLIEEFRTRLAETPHTWVEWTSSQLLQNTPLHPLADWGRHRFAGEARLAELEAVLKGAGLDPSVHAPLLALLLDISVPPDRAPKLAAEELRRRQLAAIVAWLLAGAQQQPVLLAFEDLHWVDPTTLDLMKTLAERGARGALMIVATARPEFRAPWATRSHHAVISLVPLDRAQIRAMVTTIAERHALTRETIEGVIERTGGVPLFIEEVTRLILEGGAQTIPPTLQQLLAARLDRLGEAREVAQIGAVLGREFSYALLQAVADLPTLDASLEKLADADLLFVEGLAPAASYRFKHALIQNAAYESLLKGRRQALHRRAAEALLAAADAQPELVAHHFTQSGQTEFAIEWWGKAGDAALKRSAFQEAISHLGRAIEMADNSVARAAGDATESPLASGQLKLQTDLGKAMMWLKGYGSQETSAAFARARELTARIADPAERFATYYGQWANTFMRGEFASARDIAAFFLREAENCAQTPEMASGNRMLGLTSHQQGDFATASLHLTEALKLYDPRWSPDEKFRLGPEPGLTTMAYLANTEWALGRVERARSLISESVSRSLESGHVPTLGSSYTLSAQLEALRGDPLATQRAAETAAEYTREHALGQYQSMAKVYLGWAWAQQGNRKVGMAELKDGLTTHAEKGNKAHMPFFMGLLADIEAGEQVENSLAQIDAALALALETGEHYTDAFLHRVRGAILLRRDPANPFPANEAFLAAISIARKQGARTFELLAALPLARLFQSTNRLVEAHETLAAALEGFTPTLELPAIAEGQALKAALATRLPTAATLKKRKVRSTPPAVRSP